MIKYVDLSKMSRAEAEKFMEYFCKLLGEPYRKPKWYDFLGAL